MPDSAAAMQLVLLPLVGLLALFLLGRAVRALSHRALVAAGLCRYHSALLYTTRVRGRLELHLGTGLDFLLADETGRRRVLASLAEGLLALCDEVARGELSAQTEILGFTDLLRDGTARRLGFEVSRPSPLRLAVTLSACVQVALLRSLLRRGAVPVRVSRLRRLRTTAGSLAARRAELECLRARLSAPAYSGSRWTVSGEKAGTQTATYSAPSVGVL